MHEKLGHSMDNGFIFLKINENVKERKRSWGLIRIYQLISTANPAQFHSNRAGLAVLIGWPPGSFSLFYIYISTFIYLFILNMKPLSFDLSDLLDWFYYQNAAINWL